MVMRVVVDGNAAKSMRTTEQTICHTTTAVTECSTSIFCFSPLYSWAFGLVTITITTDTPTTTTGSGTATTVTTGSGAGSCGSGSGRGGRT